MLEDTYGHTPARKAFELGDVYGVGYDEERARRRPLRLAFLGAGGVVQSKHLPALWRLKTLWEPVELAAVCDPAEEAGRKVATLYGCAHYRDAAQLLDAERPDGVVVAAPDDRHYALVTLCLERGIPVLGEKPIARSLAHADAMCDLAEARGVPLMTVANKRFSPPYRRARQLIERGPVRDPALFAGKFNLGYDYVWLLEQGTIHLFDLVGFLIGPVAEVQAYGVNKYRRNKLTYPIDNAVINLRFASGAVGTIYTSSTALSFKPWERVEVYADKAWLAVEDQCELTLYDREEGPAQQWRPVVPNTLLFDEEFGGFMGLLENFLQVIRGVEAPAVTGRDGYRAYELNCAAHLSVQRGAPVALPLDPQATDAALRAWLRAPASEQA
jgi:predicted dehydrogenase